jgi:hypothetical protein
MNITSRHFLKTAGVAALALACGITIASAQAVVIERGVMPAPRVEVIPAVPGAGYNWVPGHWVWRGGWVWAPGHHIRYYWVKGHHVWEGGHWGWHRGVWVR